MSEFGSAKSRILSPGTLRIYGSKTLPSVGSIENIDAIGDSVNSSRAIIENIFNLDRPDVHGIIELPNSRITVLDPTAGRAPISVMIVACSRAALEEELVPHHNLQSLDLKTQERFWDLSLGYLRAYSELGQAENNNSQLQPVITMNASADRTSSAERFPQTLSPPHAVVGLSDPTSLDGDCNPALVNGLLDEWSFLRNYGHGERFVELMQRGVDREALEWNNEHLLVDMVPRKTADCPPFGYELQVRKNDGLVTGLDLALVFSAHQKIYARLSRSVHRSAKTKGYAATTQPSFRAYVTLGHHEDPKSDFDYNVRVAVSPVFLAAGAGPLEAAGQIAIRAPNQEVHLDPQKLIDLNRGIFCQMVVDK